MKTNQLGSADETRSFHHGGGRKVSGRSWEVAGICVMLVILVALVFGQTLRHGFVNYDDGPYVSENPVVTQGISLEGVSWAFTHSLGANWHPLTTLSHMLDCQIYGMWAGGHHLTSVLLHALAVVLLFLMLREMTGFLWRSAFVAAVFAIHPLRVESVAWVAERKDVLSGVFFMLTLWAYTRYSREKSRGRYALVVVWLILGLMSKPMLVTVPFVLLILDYWPLGRLQQKSQLPRLLWEKLPLFALSVLSCVATVIAQSETIATFARLPLHLRLENAAVACVSYAGKLIWPVNLAVLYPAVKDGRAGWQWIGVGLLLLAVSASCWILRKKQPYLVTGWLWYLGMLVPVSGIVQVGYQALADRYTYLPQIGLCLAATWAVSEWTRTWRHRRRALGAGAVMVLVALVITACRQTFSWRDSETLWAHAIESTHNNCIAHSNLAEVMLQQGRGDEAIAHCREALRIDSTFADTHTTLGLALLRQGQTDEALAECREALRINPALADAHNVLGFALFQQGRLEEAMVQYQEALRINPAYADAHYNLGVSLHQRGRTEEAITQYRAVVKLDPRHSGAYANLGLALFQRGKSDEAIGQMQRALDLQPGDVMIQNRFAWLLATALQGSLRNGPRAVQLATQASETSGHNNPLVLRTLAAAYAEAADFPAAVQTAQHALELAEIQSNAALVASLRRELKLYEAGQPFRENP